MDDAEAVRSLWKLARQHDRGIFCPAAMWGEVVRVLDGPDPSRVLSLAPAECGAALRRIYHERPWSLHGEGRDEVSRRVVAAVESWCLAPGADRRCSRHRPHVGFPGHVAHWGGRCG